MYTGLRVALFVASYAVVAGIWMLATRTDSVPILGPFLVAALVSAVASLYLLKGPRERFAARVEQRAANATRRFEEARAKEDRD